MKRAPELHPLSRQHRAALILARNLSQAGEGSASLPATIQAFRAAWTGWLQSHLRVEEELLVPEFRRVGGDEAILARIRSEHDGLRSMASEMRSASHGALAEIACRFGRALHDHVRFEERVWFPQLEAAVPEPQLAALGRSIADRCLTCAC